MKKTAFVSCLLTLTIFFCIRENETGGLAASMSDAPGHYEAVRLDIRDVQIRHRGNGETRWISLPNVNKGIYQLPYFSDPAETALSGPAPGMDNIRLVLGDSNSVVIGGVSYPLKTPGMHESGLKLQAELTKGVTYAVLLDLAASARKTGDEKYILKPVLKVISETLDGAVAGQVIPAELNVAVYAVSGSDTISTGRAPARTSEFFLGNLPGGKYTIVFDAGISSGYDVIKLEDVLVTNDAAVAYASVD